MMHSRRKAQLAGLPQRQGEPRFSLQVKQAVGTASRAASSRDLAAIRATYQQARRAVDKVPNTTFRAMADLMKKNLRVVRMARGAVDVMNVETIITKMRKQMVDHLEMREQAQWDEVKKMLAAYRKEVAALLESGHLRKEEAAKLRKAEANLICFQNVIADPAQFLLMLQRKLRDLEALRAQDTITAFVQAVRDMVDTDSLRESEALLSSLTPDVRNVLVDAGWSEVEHLARAAEEVAQCRDLLEQGASNSEIGARVVKLRLSLGLPNARLRLDDAARPLSARSEVSDANGVDHVVSRESHAFASESPSNGPSRSISPMLPAARREWNPQAPQTDSHIPFSRTRTRSRTRTKGGRTAMDRLSSIFSDDSRTDSRRSVLNNALVFSSTTLRHDSREGPSQLESEIVNRVRSVSSSRGEAEILDRIRSIRSRGSDSVGRGDETSRIHDAATLAEVVRKSLISSDMPSVARLSSLQLPAPVMEEQAEDESDSADESAARRSRRLCVQGPELAVIGQLQAERLPVKFQSPNHVPTPEPRGELFIGVQGAQKPGAALGTAVLHGRAGVGISTPVTGFDSGVRGHREGGSPTGRLLAPASWNRLQEGGPSGWSRVPQPMIESQGKVQPRFVGYWRHAQGSVPSHPSPDDYLVATQGREVVPGVVMEPYFLERKMSRCRTVPDGDLNDGVPDSPSSFALTALRRVPEEDEPMSPERRQRREGSVFVDPSPEAVPRGRTKTRARTVPAHSKLSRQSVQRPRTSSAQPDATCSPPTDDHLQVTAPLPLVRPQEPLPPRPPERQQNEREPPPDPGPTAVLRARGRRRGWIKVSRPRNGEDYDVSATSFGSSRIWPRKTPGTAGISLMDSSSKFASTAADTATMNNSVAQGEATKFALTGAVCGRILGGERMKLASFLKYGPRGEDQMLDAVLPISAW